MYPSDEQKIFSRMMGGFSMEFSYGNMVTKRHVIYQSLNIFQRSTILYWLQYDKLITACLIRLENETQQG